MRVASPILARPPATGGGCGLGIGAVLRQFFLVRGVLYHVSMFGAPELRNGASDGGSFRQVSERGMTEVLEDLIRQNTENCIFKFLTPTSVLIAFSLCLVQRYLEFLLTRLLSVLDLLTLDR